MSDQTAERERRLKWFNEARFGMFIHWGLYSIPARGEWVRYHERIPMAEYDRLADQFRPRSFDPGRWVSLARDAGMCYMVLTTRHHDGFCLFDSQASDFTSTKRAAGRDFVAAYVEACRREGMRIGFYYSLLDWRFGGYIQGEEMTDESRDRMVAQAHAQVRELLTNYGHIDVLWYDGGWLPRRYADWQVAEFWRSAELNAMARSLQPHVIINDRSGLPEDFGTPEQKVVPAEPGRAWETCMTVGDVPTWGYCRHNPNMKPTVQLIQYLVASAAGAGNYLLNCGPQPDGAIRPEEQLRLRQMGDWMRLHGESIYGSERCAFGAGMLGLTTAKGDTAYLHVFRWPGTEACIAGVANTVRRAHILATGLEVGVEQPPNGRLILTGLPEDPPDAWDTVMALELDGPPRAC